MAVKVKRSLKLERDSFDFYSVSDTLRNRDSGGGGGGGIQRLSEIIGEGRGGGAISTTACIFNVSLP